MKIALIITAIISLILVESCGGSKKTSSSSGTSEEKFYSRRLTPVIDGKMNEWGETLLYDNNTKSIYALANDDTALYIVIKAVDRMQQMKIVQGGMEIWIDDKAKKKKSTGIKFPMGGGGMAMPAGRSNGQEKDGQDKAMRQQMRLKMLTMELTGFKEGINGSHDVYSNLQVKPVIDWDDKDNMIYELVIPFAALDETVRANLANISIGIVIKGLKMDEAPGGGMPAGGPPGGGRPGGGGPPGGGMRPGGGGMPDRSQMDNMSKDNSFWTKYTIAKTS